MSDLALMAVGIVGVLAIVFVVCLVVGGLFSLALRLGGKR